MKIEYIDLKNYRPFKNQKIEFNTKEDSSNFTIIEGANGAGKSSLLNAITWCIYNKEIHLKEDQVGLPIFNTDAFSKIGKGDIIETSVEIQMIDKENKRHNFKRTVKYTKNNENLETLIRDPTSKEKDGSTFYYYKEENSQSKIVTDPRFYLEQIMPENILEYFFFDGEQLNQYFRMSSGEKIKQAVFDISQISILERVINKRLKPKRRELGKDIKDMDPEIDSLRSKIEFMETNLEKFREDLRDKRLKKAEAEELERKISEDLEESNYGNLEKERKKIEDDLKNIEEDISKQKENKINKLLKIANPILCNDSLLLTKKLVDEGIISGEYPPDVKKDFLEALLNKNKCICGSDLSNEKSRAHLKKLLERVSTSSEICSEIIKMQGIIRDMIDEIEKFDEEHVRLSINIRKLEDKRDSLIKEQEILLKTIGSAPEQIIRNLKENLENTKEIIKKLIVEISQDELNAKYTEKEIGNDRDKLNKLLKKQDRYKMLYIMSTFLDDSIDIAEKIKNEIMNEVRIKIEEKTKEQFFSLIWNPEAFTDVKIDEDYNISVTHLSGREGIGTLSAGQRQVLALSFIAAIKKVSGFDVPILIDTPLGRISKLPKSNIAKNLPNYLKDSQVIMLVTDEEYTPEVRELLKSRVGKEYRIILDSPTSAKVVNYV